MEPVMAIGFLLCGLLILYHIREIVIETITYLFGIVINLVSDILDILSRITDEINSFRKHNFSDNLKVSYITGGLILGLLFIVTILAEFYFVYITMQSWILDEGGGLTLNMFGKEFTFNPAFILALSIVIVSTVVGVILYDLIGVTQFIKSSERLKSRKWLNRVCISSLILILLTISVLQGISNYWRSVKFEEIAAEVEISRQFDMDIEANSPVLNNEQTDEVTETSISAQGWVFKTPAIVTSIFAGLVPAVSAFCAISLQPIFLMLTWLVLAVVFILPISLLSKVLEVLRNLFSYIMTALVSVVSIFIRLGEMIHSGIVRVIDFILSGRSSGKIRRRKPAKENDRSISDSAFDRTGPIVEDSAVAEDDVVGRTEYHYEENDISNELVTFSTNPLDVNESDRELVESTSNEDDSR